MGERMPDALGEITGDSSGPQSEKMRFTYKAQIDDAKIPDMVGYLGNLPD